MRIIAGTLKGRRLASPRWPGIRPTSDELRERLFNILAPRLADASVLDAYAGTGAIGIEALSRGAAHVTFVEADRRAEALILENLARCGITDRYAIIRERVSSAFLTLRARRFDLVVLDPPYDQEAAADVAGAASLVARDGLLVLEHARRRQAPEAAGRLLRTREVRAGSSALTFYQALPER